MRRLMIHDRPRVARDSVYDTRGISGDPEFTETLTRCQLVNEPGFANVNNAPLDKGHVTLSTTDKITFN